MLQERRYRMAETEVMECSISRPPSLLDSELKPTLPGTLQRKGSQVEVGPTMT